MTHDPQDHATRATLRALDAQQADTLADALRPDAAPVAPSLDLDAIVARAASVYPEDAGWNGDEAERALETVTEHVPALVAEVRRLRMELHGAQHALAEASRGRAAASLRAADAEHVATVAMRDGLAECERLRRYTVQLKASCRAAAADAEQSGRTNARSQQEVGRLRGVLHVLNTAAAADAHRSTAAALELAKLRAEERDAALAAVDAVRADYAPRALPPTAEEVRALERMQTAAGLTYGVACFAVRMPDEFDGTTREMRVDRVWVAVREWSSGPDVRVCGGPRVDRLGALSWQAYGPDGPVTWSQLAAMVAKGGA